MTTDKKEKVFIYGAQYYRPPTPPRKERPKDLKQIKELGFNTIKIQPQWNYTNPAEGEFDFSEAKEVLDLAAKNGLKVMITTILENAPYWLAEKYPEAKYRSFGGEVVELQAVCGTPSGGWPGLCLDHPEVRKAAGKWLQAIAMEFKDHPALFCWHAWEEACNEPYHYLTNWPIFFPKNLFCVCDSTLKRFRERLKEKYGSISVLNDKWHTRYGNWQQITPPNRPGGAYSFLMDWFRFDEERSAETLSWRVKTIKSADSKHAVISHSGPSTVPAGVGKDNWTLAREVDAWGISLFPKWQWQELGLSFVNQVIEAAISPAKNKPCYVMELQAGGGMQNGIFPGVQPTPDDIAAWVFLALSCGMKGILYWGYRAEISPGQEAPGFGLCDAEGNLTARTDVAAKISKAISQYPILTEGEPLPAEAGILHNREHYHILMSAGTRGELVSGSVRGIYRALWETNIPIRFVHLEKDSSSEIARYKILYLPFPSSLTDAQAEKIKEYVANGGTLISECNIGQYDEYGYPDLRVPGKGLDKVFGCVRQDVGEPIEKEEIIIMPGGKKITARHFRETYKLTTGKSVGKYRDGKIAVVKNNYGKGTTLLFGSLVFEGQENNKILAGFLPESVQSKIDVTPNIFARMLSGKEEKALILINTGKGAAKVKVKIKNESFAARPKEIWQGKNITLRDGTASVSLKPLETAVLCWNRRS